MLTVLLIFLFLLCILLFILAQKYKIFGIIFIIVFIITIIFLIIWASYLFNMFKVMRDDAALKLYILNNKYIEEEINELKDFKDLSIDEIILDEELSSKPEIKEKLDVYIANDENINRLKKEKEDLKYYEKVIYPDYLFKNLFKNY